MFAPLDEALPRFEIDQKDEYGQFFLTDAREIEFYLGLLVKRRSIVTAYVDTGEHFFSTTLLAIDTAERQILLDPAPNNDRSALALTARQVTLVTSLDRVRIEFRLDSLVQRQYQGQALLAASIPETILRLQRREFYRLETPLSVPIICRLATQLPDGTTRTFELPLSDISGGGVSLNATVDMAPYFERDTLFQNCRLELPGDSVVLVNLQVRKAVELSGQDGEPNLCVGCEFVNLPGARLGQIERYIVRAERERKARDSGLVKA